MPLAQCAHACEEKCVITDTALPTSAPEAQGIGSTAIQAFVQAAEQRALGLHSLLLLRHGHVVASGWWYPYVPARPHMLYSLSKSFAASAIGLLAAEGRLSLDDDVLRFFPDDAPPVIGPHLAAMRVRDLLTMSTGHDVDPTDKAGEMTNRADGNWTKGFLAQPVAYAPGTHFVYNSGATYMLSAIVQAVTGDTLLRYLEPRLLAPMGIAGATWETCPRGINVGGWGLSITTDAIARFGQLYLQDGVWQGRRILPAGWVEQATSAQVRNGSNPSSDWEQGYGYQFWRCRHNAYRGDGAFGQFCVVLPEHDAVLAITAGTPDSQAVLDLAWEHLLPALHAAPLPDDPAAHAALRQTLAGLRMPAPVGRRASPLTPQLSGGVYSFTPNDQQIESITFDFANDGCTLTLRVAGDEERIVCGADDWAPSESRLLDGRAPRPVAARGVWASDDTYVAALCFYETPYCATLTCRFAGATLRYNFRANVSFGPPQRPELLGERST
ncbi:MAG: serine hydrolase [Chloroflexales bacterium]|nr:serine hydrolase [Chloroflexales bacterium]